MKGDIRWSKLCGAVDGLDIGDQNTLNLLGTFSSASASASADRELKWIDLVPMGLRCSYVS